MIINALKVKFNISYGCFLRLIIVWLNAWYIIFFKKKDEIDILLIYNILWSFKDVKWFLYCLKYYIDDEIIMLIDEGFGLCWLISWWRYEIWLRWCCFMIKVDFMLRSWDSHPYEFLGSCLQLFKVLECLAMLIEL